MVLYSYIIDSRPVREWKRAGNWERASWIIWIGVPSVMAWVDLYGYLPKGNLFSILFVVFFALSTIAILLNASIRHERDNVKLDLIKERDKASNAIETVYADKNQEIEKLRIDTEKQVKDAGELARMEKERANRKTEAFKLKKYAYDELLEKYKKLDLEYQKLSGNYRVDLDPAHTNTVFNDVTLERRTLLDRIRLKDLPHAEASEIADRLNRGSED